MVRTVRATQFGQWAASRQERRRRRSRRHNPNGTMSLVEHIYELRNRLGMAVLAVSFGGVLGFLWFQYRVGPVPSLGSLMTEPYCALDPKLRVNLNGGNDCKLLQTQPLEAFLVRFKVGVSVGAVLTSPAWLYQFWAFITPGLHRKEKKFTATFVACAVVLFACGAVLAYVIVPAALNVLLSFGGEQFISALTGNDYVSFVLSLLMIFGISFELPLVIVMLNRVGVLPYEKLRKWRRGIIFALFVFAAVVTPSDPFSMLALVGALTVLFEFAVQLSRLHDRKAARAAEDREELDAQDTSVHSLPPDSGMSAKPVHATSLSGGERETGPAEIR
jgi:sec-independent protein translocase protein TatC